MNAQIEHMIEKSRVDAAFRAGQQSMIAALLNTPDGHTLFGQPIRVTVEWPKGQPDERLLRAFIESALHVSERYAPQTDTPGQGAD